MHFVSKEEKNEQFYQNAVAKIDLFIEKA